MKRAFGFLGCVLFLCALGCDQPASDLAIERLPDIQPNLPSVPQIPESPHPDQYPDSSYSIHGVRLRAATTMGQDLEVTGYIVALYEPPECEEGRTCPPADAPHMWIGDTAEAPQNERLMVVGYADNHEAIEEAIADARRGRHQAPESETGIIPIPTDFGVGAKVKVRGHFAHMSAAGFNAANGLLEYRGHETVEPAPETED